NQILYDRRGGGTSPRRDTYGPQVDRGRRSHRAPNGRCRTDRRTRSPGVFSFTSRRLIADCSPELSRSVNAILVIGNTRIKYWGYMCYGSIPELPLLSPVVLPRPCRARPDPPEKECCP